MYQHVLQVVLVLLEVDVLHVLLGIPQVVEIALDEFHVLQVTNVLPLVQHLQNVLPTSMPIG